MSNYDPNADLDRQKREDDADAASKQANPGDDDTPPTGENAGRYPGSAGDEAK